MLKSLLWSTPLCYLQCYGPTVCVTCVFLFALTIKWWPFYCVIIVDALKAWFLIIFVVWMSHDLFNYPLLWDSSYVITNFSLLYSLFLVKIKYILNIHIFLNKEIYHTEIKNLLCIILSLSLLVKHFEQFLIYFSRIVFLIFILFFLQKNRSHPICFASCFFFSLSLQDFLDIFPCQSMCQSGHFLGQELDTNLNPTRLKRVSFLLFQLQRPEIVLYLMCSWIQVL